MKLIQYDGCEDIIAETEVDVGDYRMVLDAIMYFDTNYAPHQKLIKDWIESGLYKTEDLVISGEDPEDDGFYTETMYLEMV
ncbi:hypothetical protein CHUUTOTORO_00510 [Serratia phage vB_SmaM-ChuuTotoro]|nr:hypothetical protein CHUUTOTORO_00510 [Serratia phage vB_SmaM-ChuuTotoro]